MKKVTILIAGIFCFGLLIAAVIVSLTSLTAEEEETIASADEAESYEAELIKAKEALYPRPTYSNVKTKNAQGNWFNNTASPTAPLPYSVSGSSTSFTVSGGPWN